MVILDNSRTLGAFERQSRGYCIIKILFLYLHQINKVLIILKFRFMETTIKTSFNFAKEIQCNFITKNSNLEHSYPGGLPEFITPYLQELQENTIIPDCTTLISITSIDNPDQDGIHILTFLKNDLKHFDDDDTASITCIECLRDTFAYDPEACFGQAPIITEFNSFFTVSIPYNY